MIEGCSSAAGTAVRACCSASRSSVRRRRVPLARAFHRADALPHEDAGGVEAFRAAPARAGAASAPRWRRSPAALRRACPGPRASARRRGPGRPPACEAPCSLQLVAVEHACALRARSAGAARRARRSRSPGRRTATACTGWGGSATTAPGSATAMSVANSAVCPCATLWPGNWMGMLCAPSESVPCGAISRSGPLLRTATPMRTVAGEAFGVARATAWSGSLGSSSSLWPIGRTLTGPSSPPQLNHVR